MNRIAIAGAGIAGLVSAHGFRRAGWDVTVYSDRTPADWLERARPPATAARFELALAYERALGLDHRGEAAPRGAGVHLSVCLKA